MTAHISPRGALLLKALALCLIAIETACVLYWPASDKNIWHTALGLIASGLALGLLFFIPLRASTPPTRVARRAWVRWIPLAVLGAGIFWLVGESLPLYQEMPLAKQNSDVIPSIAVMVNRFLSGTYPYVPILDFGYHLEATYLPMQWLPYIPAEIAGFDYRHIAFTIWAAGAGVVVWRAARHPLAGLLVALLLVWQYASIIQRSDGTIKMTVEGMVSGYYMLLMAAMNRGRAAAIGLAVGVCLLSRYSLVLWLPLAAVVWWKSAPRRTFWITVGTVAAVVLLLYVLPFLSQDPGSFLRGYKLLRPLGPWRVEKSRVAGPALPPLQRHGPRRRVL